MRKHIPINLTDYSDEEWINLPQGTRIHPKEIEKMFDDEEMGERGREYIAEISETGNVDDENYGDNREAHLIRQRYLEEAKESTMTHSHPRFILQQELDEGLVTAPPLTNYDLENYDREIRAFSQDVDKDSGRIHSFKHSDEGTDEDILKRKKMGGYFISDLKELHDKYENTQKFKQAMKTVKGFPMSTNMFTAANFNLSRRGAGQASIINVKKSETPNKVYITKIRSTYNEEPHFELLKTLPRKKKQNTPSVKRKRSLVSFPKLKPIKLNLNGLNSILLKPKIASKKRK